MRPLMIALLLACWTPLARGQATNPAVSCQILTDPVVFGAYSVISRTPELAVGRVELRCLGRSVTPAARIMLSTGTSGGFQQRTLLNGANRLTYNLYVDAGRHIIAGDGTQGTATLAPVPADVGLKQFRGGLQAAARVVFRIYAKLDPGQLVPAGDYADQIRVTVEF